MSDVSIPYYFHDKVILRTPLFPLQYGVSPEVVLAFFKDPIPKEALYIASPVLHSQYNKWLSGQSMPEKEFEKLLYSLTRYYYRMNSRCTPFGLLASVSLTSWESDPGHIELDDLETIQRVNRLDMYTVCLIQEHLLKHTEIRRYLKFFPNNSIYPVGEDLRYIEYSINGELRNHQITSVGNSEYISLILQHCEKGALLSDVAAMLVEYDIEEEEALEFLEQLVDAQLLVSELEPNTTGAFFFDRIIEVLKRINAQSNDAFTSFWINSLLKIQDRIKFMDGAPAEHYEVYQEVLDILKNAGIEAVESKLCQADSWRPLRKQGIDCKIKDQFLRMMAYLNQLQTFKTPPSWQNFIDKFSERYETREIPLLKVLDDELGLGFGNSINQDDNTFTKDVLIPSAANFSTTEWSADQTLLLNQMLDAYASNDYTIRINPANYSPKTTSWDLLPPSFSVIFRQVEGGKCWVETVGNASAANLIGRFAYLHDEIRALLENICEEEQRHNESVIFAEVVHLPGSRVGNILLRPTLRKYEISFLAQPGVEDEFALSLSDLFVSVKNGRVMLRSKRLNKFIIPKLTSAHNYHYYTQPLYKFLCDLQTQDFRFFLTYTLSDLGSQLLFCPRVEFENIILSPATWVFTNKMMEPVIKAKDTETRMAEMRRIREQYKMPRFVSLVETDIEMVVDTEDPLLVNVMVSDSKNNAQIAFREYLGYDETAVKDSQGRVYANQFICSVIRNKPVYANGYHPEPSNVPIRRVFIPGDPWMFFKIYTGVKTMDKLLVELIRPMVHNLKQKGIVDKWFFIRYADPENHLRVRFLLNQQHHYAELTAIFSSYLQSFIAEGLVWKVQMDTYNREIERYGANTMEVSETLFDADSTATAAFLSDMGEHTTEDLRWLWAMKTTDQLLDQLGFDIDRKTGLMNHLKSSFAVEFRIDNSPIYLKQLSRKYRDNRDVIRRFMGNESDFETEEAYPFWKQNIDLHRHLIEEPCKAILEVAARNELEMPLELLAASYIHMKFNRLFTSYQRKHELVLYDLLHQIYKTSHIMSTVHS